MSTLPITHVTLYKHGVGYFRRRGVAVGPALKLTFKQGEMNDVLKSLTIIDHSGGRINSLDYDTPQDQDEKLAGSSINLRPLKSIHDLLLALRGRQIELRLQNNLHESGILVGLDDAKTDEGVKNALVSILRLDTGTVALHKVSQVESVELVDHSSAEDLRFFLDTVMVQENHRSITVRLGPGEHDLEVSYIAPAPMWRVSYRLFIDAPTPNPTEPPIALLQGWGIFDNQLDEDLKNINLSLTAGMPISFRYNLDEPHTPTRPLVEPEERVTPGAIAFEEPMLEEYPAQIMAPPPSPMAARSASFGAKRREAAQSVPSAATSKALGELFQYTVQTPITVSRGQSAMVPIVSASLEYKKDLIYNRQKMPVHPVATLRFTNNTDLTLENGPLTVLEGDTYVGEALLPFTQRDGEAIIAYAVELGLHIHEQSERETQLHTLSLKGAYLVRQVYHIQRTIYLLDNRTPTPKTVLIEHPLTQDEIFDTPDPKEKTAHVHRYEVNIPARRMSRFVVQARRLHLQQEKLESLSMQSLQSYFKDNYLDEVSYKHLQTLLKTWANIENLRHQIAAQEQERQKIYQAQGQVQKNMQVLGQAGQEGALRNRYVAQLTQHEETLAQIDQRIEKLQQDITQHQNQIKTLLAELGT